MWQPLTEHVHDKRCSCGIVNHEPGSHLHWQIASWGLGTPMAGSISQVIGAPSHRNIFGARCFAVLLWLGAAVSRLMLPDLRAHQSFEVLLLHC